MSTVEVEILGDGKFAGSIANVEDYSLNEYGSPLSMTDLQAGVGGISFSVLEDPSFNGSMLLPGQPFELRDPWAGRQRGLIDEGTSIDEYMLDVSASGALLPLVSQREAAAFTGTLGGAITYYCGLCGVDSGFQFDPEISFIPVNLPRWKGDVWNQLKKLQAIHQFELADVAGTIVVRKLRLRTAEIDKVTSSRLSYGRTGASQIVEVHYYNNQYETNKQVYPDPESSIVDRPIISVNAGETSVNNYPVNMWVDTIDEPSQVSSLPWDNTSATSVYAVVDKDGNPVTVQDWSNGGGLVSFAVGADGRSIDVTVRGMITQSRAPYRIASSSADREYQYAALYIAATGVSFDEKVLWSHTGADLTDAPSDAITVIDDPMVSTIEEAAVVLANAARESSGFSQQLEVSATTVNRRGETGQQLYPTFAEWNTAHPGMTFAQFNTLYDNVTFEEYTEIQGAGYVNDFDSQAFGGIGGARARFRDNIYRIRQATSRPSGFSWSAQSDLLFAEWNETFPGVTFADFNSVWAGKTFEQHARMPLAGSGTFVESRRNYMQDPRFTDGTGSWGITAGTYTVAGGVMSASFTPSATSNAITPTRTAWWTPFAPGDVISAGYMIENVGSVSAQMRVALWNGLAYVYGPTVTVDPGEKKRVAAENLPVGAGSSYAQPRLHFAPGSPSGTRDLKISEPIAEKSSTLGDYFDGSLAPEDPTQKRNRWSGIVNASQSIQETFIPRVG